MATYIGSRETQGVQPIYHPSGIVGEFATFSLTAGLANGDVIAMMDVPAFAVIHDVILSTDTLDTNATGAITYSVGDSTVNGRFILAAAQGNNIPLPPTHMNVAAGLGFQYLAQTTVNVYVTHAPGTAASTGKVRLWISYSFEALNATVEGTELP